MVCIADCLSTNKDAIEFTTELEAGLAVDGFPDTHSCTESNEAFPWWSVDLGEEYYVDNVVVTFPSINGENRNYRQYYFG